MNRHRTIITGVILLTIAAIAVYQWATPPGSSSPPETVLAPISSETVARQPPTDTSAPTAPLPLPEPEVIPLPEPDSLPITHAAIPKQPQIRPLTPEQEAYYRTQALQFDQRRTQLELEHDSIRRNQLIQQLSYYVAIDTMETLNWAMSLLNPNEQRTALEAINNHAVVGIGARIESDEESIPVIRETTTLSAIADTGLVDAGDRILGMVTSEGDTILFHGMPIQQVAQYLRGQPGSPVRIFIRKADNTDQFAVDIDRSMVVVDNPIQ
jgi:C-terminal processing protease CtpA/Prc